MRPGLTPVLKDFLQDVDPLCKNRSHYFKNLSLGHAAALAKSGNNRFAQMTPRSRKMCLMY
jgi:hypothetical protein